MTDGETEAQTGSDSLEASPLVSGRTRIRTPESQALKPSSSVPDGVACCLGSSLGGGGVAIGEICRRNIDFYINEDIAVNLGQLFVECTISKIREPSHLAASFWDWLLSVEGQGASFGRL